MKEILLKDIDDGEILAILTVPETVSLEDVEAKVFDMRDVWSTESDLTLVEYLVENCPEEWSVTIPEQDDREVIEI